MCQTVSGACDVAEPDELYLQQALYFAAGRDASGHRSASGHNASMGSPVVLLSPGRHLLSVALPSWYPFGVWAGLHVPSGVTLAGSSSGSTLALSHCVWLGPGGAGCIGAATPLDNLILISDYRVGAPNMSTDEFLRPAVG